MKKVVFIFLMSSLSLMAVSNMLEATPFKVVQSSIGKGKPYFVEVGSEHCWACQKMGKMLYTFKEKYLDVNIVFVDVQKEREAAYRLGVNMIPTQIFYNAKGVEVYRHVGALSEREVVKLFQK